MVWLEVKWKVECWVIFGLELRLSRVANHDGLCVPELLQGYWQELICWWGTGRTSSWWGNWHSRSPGRDWGPGGPWIDCSLGAFVAEAQTARVTMNEVTLQTWACRASSERAHFPTSPHYACFLVSFTLSLEDSLASIHLLSTGGFTLFKEQLQYIFHAHIIGF